MTPLTEEQWRAAWILCETAGDLEPDAQREYVIGATIDPAVGERVIAVFEELAEEPAFAAAPDRRVGDRVGRYVLLERIGQGGMGEVYAAEDVELARRVALKFMPSDLPATAASSARIIREARAASALNHPNIVTVYEVIQSQWGLAMAMELVEGQSLRALMRAGPPAQSGLGRRQVIQIGRQIASALAAAHRARIVHRDVKPENVMVRPDGYVKVMDFGLAQKIRENVVEGSIAQLPLGTARYMSPEQKRGEEVTGASDIYALGIMLEEMGPWRHSLLASMHSAAIEQRPSAEEVATRLAALEKSGRNRWMGGIAVLALAMLTLAGILIGTRPKPVAEPKELAFNQVTHRSEGHDVGVAAVSSDGTKLAFSTVDGGLFLRDNRTSEVHELAPPAKRLIYQLFLAGDSLLALVAGEGSGFEIWRVPMGDGAAQRLRDDVEAAALSHDGKRLAWLTKSTHEVWTGPLSGADATILFKPAAGDVIPILLWSGDDTRLWVSTLRDCSLDYIPVAAFIDPRDCAHDELSFWDATRKQLVVAEKNLRLLSGFFTTRGELLFLRAGAPEDDRGLWALAVNLRTGMAADAPRILARLPGLAQLTGSADGRSLAVVRTEHLYFTAVADWKREAVATALRQRRLTLEESNAYPYAWMPDSRSVIFETDRFVSRDLFQQKLASLEAAPLAQNSQDKFMPQVTPDGKWILFHATDGGQDYNPNALRSLERVPIRGGEPVKVPLSAALDEFRCSLPGRGKRCVLRTTSAGRQTYFELDPVLGQGRELAVSNKVVVGLGRWALSSDGATVAIPDDETPGQFYEITLDLDPSKRRERKRQVRGLAHINGLGPVPSGNGWLASSHPGLPRINATPILSLLKDPGRMEGLYLLDKRLQSHFLYKTYFNAFGVLSPDEKHIALLNTELNSNIWMLNR